jgi:RimJ/RimL family protein N-acetyltransferase
VSAVPERRTARLLLRGFRGDDLGPLAALNADPVVMEHLPGPMTLQDSAAQLARFRQHWEEHGFGWWAVEVPGVAPFIGWVGLARPRFEAHFTPCVEIGWRLAAAHWNQGYATEGAREGLRFGWELGAPRLEEVVAFTVPRERSLAPGDGEARHAPRPGGRLRAPRAPARAPAASPRPLPDPPGDGVKPVERPR